MRSPFRTTIAQFSNAGGRAQSRAANVRAVEPAADLAGAERGNLYVLIEVSGSGGGHAALYRQMLNAAQMAFYEAEGTLASALTRAVRNAHSVLRRANEALPEAEWRAGITCAALQGTELTLAQAGPALALVAHPKTVDQFPSNANEFTMPLGGAERPDVELARTAVEPGSMIVLADSGWLEHVPAKHLAAASTAETPAQVADYLSQLAGEAEVSALIIGLSNALPEVEDLPQSGVSTAPRADVPPAAMSGSSTGPARSQPASPKTTRVLPATPEVSTPATPSRTRSAATAAPVEPSMMEPAWRATSAHPAPGAAGEETPAGGSDGDETAPADDEEFFEAPRRRSLWPLLLAVVVIPVLIALVVLGMWYFRNQANEAQYQQMIQGARSAVAEAQTLPDEATARMRLDAARELMDKAKGLKPNDTQLAPIEAQYTQNMNRINHVTPLYGVVPLWDFTNATTGYKLDRVLTNSNALFVLDRGHQQVSHFVLSDLGDSVTPAQNNVVISATMHISDVVVSDLVDMTWAEAVNNQHSRLLVLDRANGLVGYDITWGTTQVPIAGREQWKNPVLLSSYNGNLYVVDAGANQIWRYRPGETGYETTPEPYFGPNVQVDLNGVQAMAIDGNVWLLYRDGRLLKFFAGEQKAFAPTGMPGQFRSPTAIVASRDGDQLYVADSGNERIVELDKNGTFLRQFRPAEGDAFKDMRGMYLDEATSIFYVISGEKLYKADLPRPVPTAAPSVNAAVVPPPADTITDTVTVTDTAN
jgi:hypothetical protein